MKIISQKNNENGFSWWTIEQDEKDSSGVFYLFVNNTRGVHRELVHSKNLEYITGRLEWQFEFSKKINVVMNGIIQKLTDEQAEKL